MGDSRGLRPVWCGALRRRLSENYFIHLGESHICKHARAGVQIKKTRLGVLGQPGGGCAAKIAVLCFAVCRSVLNMSGMMGAEFVLNNTKYRPKTPRVLLGGSFAVAPR